MRFSIVFVFHFPWIYTVVPREIGENAAYAKFWEQVRRIMGDVQMANAAGQPWRRIFQFSHLQSLSAAEI